MESWGGNRAAVGRSVGEAIGRSIRRSVGLGGICPLQKCVPRAPPLDPKCDPKRAPLGPKCGPKGSPQTDLWESINEQFAGTLRAQNLRCTNEYGITLIYRFMRIEFKGGGAILNPRWRSLDLFKKQMLV